VCFGQVLASVQSSALALALQRCGKLPAFKAASVRFGGARVGAAQSPKHGAAQAPNSSLKRTAAPPLNSGVSQGSRSVSENFAADPKIQQIAEAYALDAVDFAAKISVGKLDWSDSSVAHVETILSSLHSQAATAKPTPEQVFQFAKAFGSYIGETFRRNHGATWGMVTLQGQSFPGLKADGAAGLFWPWGRAQNRLTNGSEDNVWHYYQALIQRSGLPVPSEPTQAKKPWWRRSGG